MMLTRSRSLSASTPVKPPSHVSVSQHVLDSISSNLPNLRLLLVTLAIGIAILRALIPTHDATYLPGAGFSGFWYTFGRVSNLPDNKERDYHCFSAGCLVVSSVFLGREYSDVALTAKSIQQRWLDGEISRYDVASEFVDDLLELKDPANALRQDAWLPRVQVLTSNWYGGAELTTAKNRGELRELLIQTSFIPFATGFGMYHEGENDGGFSLLYHPRCKHNVMLPLTWTMLSNILNVNMGMDTVQELYEIGWNEEEAKKTNASALR